MKPVLGRTEQVQQSDMRQTWFQFHKNGQQQVDPYSPMDLPQPQVYYSVPGDVRPPQVVNQRFIQYVNNFPGRSGLPYLVQPSYFGCDYPQVHPNDNFPRMAYHDPVDVQRSMPFGQPRLHTDWNQDMHRSENKRDLFAGGDFLMSFPDKKSDGPMDLGKDKSKHAIYEVMKQNETNKDRFNHMSPFNAMAVNVCQEIESIIGTGGPGLIDMLDFCKAIQSFMVTPVTQIVHRTMMLREMILSFIHISSAYIHLSSILHMPEQPSYIQNDLNSLKNICSRWEEMSAMVIMSLRSIINLISQDSKVDFSHLNKAKESMDQDHSSDGLLSQGQISVMKGDFYHPPFQNYVNEPPLLNYSLGDNFHRFGNSYQRQGQSRQDFINNANYEFKRKFQPNLIPVSVDMDSGHFNSNSYHYFNTSNNGMVKSSFTLKNKSYISSNCGNHGNKPKKLDNHMSFQSDSVSDSDKSSHIGEMKNFNFNLNEKKAKSYSPLSPSEPEKIIMRKIKEGSSSTSSPDSGSTIKERKQPAEDTEAEGSSESGGSLSDALQEETSPTKDISDKPRWTAADSKKKTEAFTTNVLLPFLLNSSIQNQKQSSLNQLTRTDSTQEVTKQKPNRPSQAADEVKKYIFSNPELNKTFAEQSDTVKLQLKLKMLDTLSFVQSIDLSHHQMTPAETQVVQKSILEGLHRASYLVYSDHYQSLSDMLKDVRDIFHTTRIGNLENKNVMKIMDEIESNFLSLFRKEFGCCTINIST